MRVGSHAGRARAVVRVSARAKLGAEAWWPDWIEACCVDLQALHPPGTFDGEVARGIARDLREAAASARGEWESGTRELERVSDELVEALGRCVCGASDAGAPPRGGDFNWVSGRG